MSLWRAGKWARKENQPHPTNATRRIGRLHAWPSSSFSSFFFSSFPFLLALLSRGSFSPFAADMRSIGAPGSREQSCTLKPCERCGFSGSRTENSSLFFWKVHGEVSEIGPCLSKKDATPRNDIVLNTLACSSSRRRNLCAALVDRGLGLLLLLLHLPEMALAISDKETCRIESCWQFWRWRARE